MKWFHLTQAGIDGLRTEYKHLMTRRRLVAERIKATGGLGMLNEDVDYSTIRNEHEDIQNRITTIENILRNTKMIQTPLRGNRVQLGSTVKLESNGREQQFTIVGTVEADPHVGKISDESPMGQALLGKKIGDKVEITTRAKKAVYVIAAVT